MWKLESQHRIFVVDDEPVIASTLGLILNQQGFDATSFTDPLEALQAIRKKAPDFLIADVVMPGLSGIELAILMRETCPDCAVILFSGHPATETMLETARNRGYELDILAKPVHPTDMLARVRSRLALASGSEGSIADLPLQQASRGELLPSNPEVLSGSPPIRT